MDTTIYKYHNTTRILPCTELFYKFKYATAAWLPLTRSTCDNSDNEGQGCGRDGRTCGVGAFELDGV